MAGLLISSMPSGAEVKIDGEIVGTTPLTLPIDEEVGLSEFRAEWLSGGTVVCSWDALKTRLEDLTVSRLWWDLTRDERYSVAVEAIINNPYGSMAAFYYKGDPHCGGATSEHHWGSCASTSAILYTKFGVPVEISDCAGSNPTGNIDGCYFRLNGQSEIHCLTQPNPYHLPCYFAQCFHGPDFHHVMCAIQIVNSLDSLDNWIVSLYGSVDIKPGNWQMPIDSELVIYRPERICCSGLDSRSPGAITVAEFDI